MKPATRIGLLLVVFLVVAATTAFVLYRRAGATAVGQVRLQLNWKPEPQFGGFYAAQVGGAFKRAGVDVQVIPGGVGTPTVQMVGSGSAEFAVASADEVVIARSKGNDVVALLAVYQDCPQGIMVRASRGMSAIGDVFKAEGTVAMQKTLPYAQLLEKQYGFAKVQVVPSPGGNIAQFQHDERFAQQCFITSEPLAARKAGIDVRTFLVKESGFNPYTTVLVTSGQMLRKDPKTVLAVTNACREGWEAYVKDPAAGNAAMIAARPGSDAAEFAEGAKVQEPLILTDDAKRDGLGSMTLARWETLAAQLAELKSIDKAPPAAECFVDRKALEAAAK